MKRTFLLTLIALLTIPAVAQPLARQRFQRLRAQFAAADYLFARSELALAFFRRPAHLRFNVLPGQDRDRVGACSA